MYSYNKHKKTTKENLEFSVTRKFGRHFYALFLATAIPLGILAVIRQDTNQIQFPSVIESTSAVSTRLAREREARQMPYIPTSHISRKEQKQRAQAEAQKVDVAIQHAFTEYYEIKGHDNKLPLFTSVVDIEGLSFLRSQLVMSNRSSSSVYVGLQDNVLSGLLTTMASFLDAEDSAALCYLMTLTLQTQLSMLRAVTYPLLYPPVSKETVKEIPLPLFLEIYSQLTAVHRVMHTYVIPIAPFEIKEQLESIEGSSSWEAISNVSQVLTSSYIINSEAFDLVKNRIIQEEVKQLENIRRLTADMAAGNDVQGEEEEDDEGTLPPLSQAFKQWNGVTSELAVAISTELKHLSKHSEQYITNNYLLLFVCVALVTPCIITASLEFYVRMIVPFILAYDKDDKKDKAKDADDKIKQDDAEKPRQDAVIHKKSFTSKLLRQTTKYNITKCLLLPSFGLLLLLILAVIGVFLHTEITDVLKAQQLKNMQPYLQASNSLINAINQESFIAMKHLHNPSVGEVQAAEAVTDRALADIHAWTVPTTFKFTPRLNTLNSARAALNNSQSLMHEVASNYSAIQYEVYYHNVYNINKVTSAGALYLCYITIQLLTEMLHREVDETHSVLKPQQPNDPISFTPLIQTIFGQRDAHQRMEAILPVFGSTVFSTVESTPTTKIAQRIVQKKETNIVHTIQSPVGIRVVPNATMVTGSDERSDGNDTMETSEEAQGSQPLNLKYLEWDSWHEHLQRLQDSTDTAKATLLALIAPSLVSQIVELSITCLAAFLAVGISVWTFKVNIASLHRSSNDDDRHSEKSVPNPLEKRHGSVGSMSLQSN